jgi:hypothetical protein
MSDAIASPLYAVEKLGLINSKPQDAPDAEGGPGKQKGIINVPSQEVSDTERGPGNQSGVINRAVPGTTSAV